MRYINTFAYTYTYCYDNRSHACVTNSFQKREVHKMYFQIL